MNFKRIVFLIVTLILLGAALKVFLFRDKPLVLLETESSDEIKAVGEATDNSRSTPRVTSIQTIPSKRNQEHDAPIVAGVALADANSNELVEILNADSFEKIVSAARKQQSWTSSKVDAVRQANLACIMSREQLSKVKSPRNVVSPPIDSYVAHLAAIKEFSDDFCIGHEINRASINFLADMKTSNEDIEALQIDFDTLDPRSFSRFIAYLNWEPNPSFAQSAAINTTSNSEHLNFELLRSEQIQGDLSNAEIAQVYAIAAEIRSCSYSRACQAYMPYTMINCMDKLNCRRGESLIDFRMRWASQVVFESAVRLSDSWKRQAHR